MHRGFGRPLRGAFAPEVPPLLRRANQMLSAGEFAQASSAFEQLARAAEARGGPRAPLFYLQAGRAHILAGQAADGLDQIERGLGLFAMRGQAFKVESAGLRVVKELSARGLPNEAKRVADYVEELAPETEQGFTGASAAKRPALPTHCPGCNSPLQADEVEWLDEATAVCGYCGSPVQEQ